MNEMQAATITTLVVILIVIVTELLWPLKADMPT
jgi:hypothetical protein